jgi:hypothetical protein
MPTQTIIAPMFETFVDLDHKSRPQLGQLLAFGLTGVWQSGHGNRDIRVSLISQASTRQDSTFLTAQTEPHLQNTSG